MLKKIIPIILILGLTSTTVFAETPQETQQKIYNQNVKALKNQLPAQNNAFPQVPKENVPQGYKNTNMNDLLHNTYGNIDQRTLTENNNIPSDQFFQNKTDAMKNEQSIVEQKKAASSANIAYEQSHSWSNPFAIDIGSIISGNAATLSSMQAQYKTNASNIQKPANWGTGTNVAYTNDQISYKVLLNDITPQTMEDLYNNQIRNDVNNQQKQAVLNNLDLGLTQFKLGASNNATQQGINSAVGNFAQPFGSKAIAQTFIDKTKGQEYLMQKENSGTLTTEEKQQLNDMRNNNNTGRNIKDFFSWLVGLKK